MVTVYLDHAASTPVRPEALDAFSRAATVVGNPSSVHRAGQSTRALLEDARVMVAGTLGADPIEVVFTSGGTEASNLAIRGLYRRRRRENPLRRRIVIPEGEHHASIDTIEYLAAAEDAVIDWIPLTSAGHVDLRAWRDALMREPESIALATSLWVSNELGTIQPVVDLHAAAVQALVPLYVDAVAAYGHVSIDLRAIRGDAPDGAGLVAVGVSGHKVGSVQGSGALALHRSVGLEPLLHGGGQERGLRSGTPSVAAAVSLATAGRLATAALDAENQRLATLRTTLVDRLKTEAPDVRITVDLEGTSPHCLHVLVPGAIADNLIFLLDREGIAVSAGSACQAGVSAPSHVLLALGLTQAEAAGGLRISFGHTTTEADVDALARVLPGVVAQARTVSSRMTHSA